MILCVVCKVAESMVASGAGAPLCRECRAEMVLTGDQQKLDIVDRIYEGPIRGILEPMTREALQRNAMARAVKCERCGRSEVYSPTEKKTSFFCDECGKQLCRNCAASCSHKDFVGAKILCTDCRVEKSLTGQPVEETIKDLPDSEKKREPKPHCGRATCIADPALNADPRPFCECRCPKCVEAIGSGFVDPMFGKMTPDPDPEPEPAVSPEDVDIEDEEDALAREGDQA